MLLEKKIPTIYVSSYVLSMLLTGVMIFLFRNTGYFPFITFAMQWPTILFGGLFSILVLIYLKRFKDLYIYSIIALIALVVMNLFSGIFTIYADMGGPSIVSFIVYLFVSLSFGIVSLVYLIRIIKNEFYPKPVRVGLLVFFVLSIIGIFSSVGQLLAFNYLFNQQGLSPTTVGPITAALNFLSRTARVAFDTYVLYILLKKDNIITQAQNKNSETQIDTDFSY